MTQPTRQFQLQVRPGDDGERYRLDLLMSAEGATVTVARADERLVERLRSDITAGLVHSGHQRTALHPRRAKPLDLTEEAGVRLALAILAARPLRKLSRVDAVRHGIEAMTTEEAFYWYAHCTGGHANRGLRGLRTLLADE
jgi:hypothetical protein